MGGGYEYGVIGYGSLINPDEIQATVETPLTQVVPIRIDGYKRIFNNEATWREMEGNKRAVLNVEQESSEWCNGVLIPFQNQKDYEKYRQREEGYRLLEINRSQLIPYRKSDSDAVSAISHIEIPIGFRTSDKIYPIPSYVDLCMRGAGYWDENYEMPFIEDFVQTTELADGTPFVNYINDR